MTKKDEELERAMEKLEDEGGPASTAKSNADMNQRLREAQEAERMKFLTRNMWRLSTYGSTVIGGALLGLFWGGNIGAGIGAGASFVLVWFTNRKENANAK